MVLVRFVYFSVFFFVVRRRVRFECFLRAFAQLRGRVGRALRHRLGGAWALLRRPGGA